MCVHSSLTPPRQQCRCCVISCHAPEQGQAARVTSGRLFICAEVQPLSEMSSRVQSAAIRRAIDRIFPLQDTGSVVSYVASSQAGGSMVAMTRVSAIGQAIYWQEQSIRLCALCVISLCVRLRLEGHLVEKRPAHGPIPDTTLAFCADSLLLQPRLELRHSVYKRNATDASNVSQLDQVQAAGASLHVTQVGLGDAQLSRYVGLGETSLQTHFPDQFD